MDGVVMSKNEKEALNEALEYADKALNFEDERRMGEALEYYEKAISILERAENSCEPSKRDFFRGLIETYKPKLTMLQFQSSPLYAEFVNKSSIETMDFELLDLDDLNLTSFISSAFLPWERSVLLDELRHDISTKGLRTILPKMSETKRIQLILKVFYRAIKEGGSLSKSLSVPIEVWAVPVSIDEKDEFHKHMLGFYTSLCFELKSSLLAMLQSSGKSLKNVDLKANKAHLLNLQTAFSELGGAHVGPLFNRIEKALGVSLGSPWESFLGINFDGAALGGKLEKANVIEKTLFSLQKFMTKKDKKPSSEAAKDSREYHMGVLDLLSVFILFYMLLEKLDVELIEAPEIEQALHFINTFTLNSVVKLIYLELVVRLIFHFNSQRRQFAVKFERRK